MVRRSRGKRPIFSPAVFSQISGLVDQGLSAAEIAEKIGCKLGSLRVKCSQNGISLRRLNASGARPSQSKLMVSVPEEIALHLQKQAEKRGISKTSLASVLLEAVVRDNLYDAVIDGDVNRKRGSSPRRRRPKSDYD
jgi:hypothetical protein